MFDIPTPPINRHIKNFINKKRTKANTRQVSTNGDRKNTHPMQLH